MPVQIECPKCSARNGLVNRDGKSRKTCFKCGYRYDKTPGKIYWIEYRLNGRRKRERIGPSKTAAETRLSKVKTQVVEERYIQKDKNACESLGSLTEWYLNLSRVKAQSSYRRTRISLDNIKRLLGKDTKISELTTDLMEDYLKKRAEEKSRKYPDKKITVATMNRELAAIQKVLNEAVTSKRISSNPIKTVKQQRENNIRQEVLSDKQFEDLLKAAPDYMKPILLVFYYEPMRYDEIMKLEWREVDFKTEPGFIRLAANRTKGRKEGRIIPLHPRVKEALKRLPSRFQGDRVFLKNNKPVYNIRVNFLKVLKKAGIDNFTFHDFRHCAITNLRKAGNDIPTIMKISGHKTTAMFHRYNLVDEDDVANVVWKKTEPSKRSKKKAGGKKKA